MFISSSATLHLDTATSGLAQSTIDALAMGDGSSLEVGGSLRVSRSGGVIGEGDERHGLVPIIRLAESSHVEVDGQDIQWNARVEAKKDSKVSLLNAGTSIAMNRGGSLELSELSLTGADTEVRLGAGAMSLNTWDSFDVYIAHRAEVSGEYPEFADYATDVAAVDGTSSADANGVFKLVVTRDGTDQVTRCIPYHATEETMKVILDELPHVQARGNVTVRRSGKGEDPAFRFGYKWRLDFDSTVTAEYDKAMDLQLHCQGSFDGCGCSWPTVDMRDPTGQLTCPTFIQGSKTDPSKCAMQSTDLRVERLTYLSQLTTTEGDLGRVVVLGGAHRMPPVSKVLVAASGGVSMLQGDSIVWKGLEAASDAVVKVYGISWLGYDSAIVLYMPGWAQTRNFAQLQLAPSFNMAVKELQCTNMSHLLFVTPNSQFTVDKAVWGGGVIGGRAQLTVMDLMLMNDNNKALRDDVTLFIHQLATLRWVGGNVSVSNGADVHIEGLMSAESTSAVAPYFGQAQLMSAPDNSDGLSLLESDPPRMWDGYFDARVPRALRDGWFDTPICGSECRTTSEVLIRSNGIVNVVESANVVFAVPMNFVDDSRFNMRAQCSSTLESGGRFGNDVVVNMQEGSTVSLTGGRMFMEETCQITGEGDLIVLEGYHDVASLIAAKITIQGGTLAWPISRGDGRSIVFENGLTIEKIGRLEVQPWSTIIEVKKEVIFKDDCVLQFPMIGIASQPLMSDRQAGITLNASTTLRDRLDAPDPAPSGRLIARDKLTFLGGTMRGKAKFESFGVLLLDGAEKRVRSLAKLINRGVAIWGDGDILTADQGDFLNFGTLQTNSSEPGFKRGVFYEGTVIPTENGGDRYALLFHTWDVDEGQLDMAQYIAERKNYVSRAPPGWTAEWQNGLYIAGQNGYDRTDGSGFDRPISDTYEESIPLIEMNAYYDRRVYGRRLDAGGFVRHQEVEDHLLWAS
jgi:hypothetical protein